MEYRDKEVRFDLYCKKCKSAAVPESESPCWECLTEPVNEYSHKPQYYEENK